MIRRAAVLLASCVLFFFGITTAGPAQAQTGTSEIHGTIADPSGAVIPGASVVLTDQQGTTKSAVSSRDGAYRLSGIAPGTYKLSVSATGFASLSQAGVVLAAGKPLLMNLTLEIPVQQQQVEVTETTVGVSTVADSNASSIVIKGKDLDALSDDPDQLQTELTELAGPSAGPNGAQIFIDGFSNGQLPPKSSIREIRVNQNPFSAQYDKLGYGRVEILTKPGTDKLHGNFMISGNSSAFNSLNPFVKSEPAYHSLFINGGIGGSLNSKTSWFASIFRRDNASNSIINAIILDPSNNITNYSTAVASPQSRLDINPRLDFQLGSKDTLTIRYMMDRQTRTNSGISTMALESQGYDSYNLEHTVQISDSHVFSANVVNETRLQLAREITNRTPRYFTPAISVQGAFTGGGSSAGRSSDLQNRVELQNYTTIAAGRHAIQVGGRYRLTRDSNTSTGGFNGRYTYSTIDAYKNHTPSQYTVTYGKALANLSTWDVGLFFQDDYKFNQNLTLSFGVRNEFQNYLTGHGDWAPRLSIAWAPWGAKGKTVIRGGYGWFYDRFGSNSVMNTIRLSGGATSQKQYVVNNPTFYEGSDPTQIPNQSQLAAMSTTVAPTIYQLSPSIRAALSMQAAIGVERQWGKFATTSFTYVNSRGVHQYMSQNTNAYLPGTYDSDPLKNLPGTRPNGINENIYQFQSGGIYKQNQLMVNYSIQARRVSIFGFYSLTFANANTSGAGYFSSSPYNPSADYGRANFSVRNRFMFGGNLQGPFGVSMSPMLDAHSGSPFNITLGQDLNGDSQYNDRPAWATGASTSVMQTQYGTFDLKPAADAIRIPYNYGTGPFQWGLNMRLSKSFGVGPRVDGGNRGSGGFGGPGGGPHPGGGGRMGGGLGPGGLSGGGMPRGMGGPTVNRKYSLNFTAMGQNVLNHVNLAPPVSVLQSPLFGKSNSIGGGIWASAASNRSIDLQVSFNF